MILETATVVAVEAQAVWVEAVQKSACERCVAQKGCGTRVLSKLTGKTNRIRVLASTGHVQKLCPGQDVTIAIPEDVVVTASLLAYLVPLIASLMGLWLMGLISPGSDVASIAGAVIGLVIGSSLVSLYSGKIRNNPRYNPVLYEHTANPQIVGLL